MAMILSQWRRDDSERRDAAIAGAAADAAAVAAAVAAAPFVLASQNLKL